MAGEEIHVQYSATVSSNGTPPRLLSAANLKIWGNTSQTLFGCGVFGAAGRAAASAWNPLPITADTPVLFRASGGMLVEADHVSSRIAEPRRGLRRVRADRLHDLASMG